MEAQLSRRILGLPFRVIASALALMFYQCSTLAVLCKSYLEIQQEQVVIQSNEYACGAAAVATLMQYFYSVQVSESDVLNLVEESMRSRGVSPEESHGLTAFDLKEASQQLGVEMAGYLVGQSELDDYFARGGLPVIAHLTNPRKHFVVVIGIRNAFVLIADPAWGKRIVGCSEFETLRERRGVVLVPLPSRQKAGVARDAQSDALFEMERILSHLQALGEEMM
ncbi:C39 family peptidase [Candidatus Bipolaricaulota bacterium]